MEIEGLWKLLQTPQEDIDAFLASYTASVSNDAIAYVGTDRSGAILVSTIHHFIASRGEFETTCVDSQSA